ncbi:hypothetical protein AVEN_827-1 [Araneus ventricosus]|uniref:Uncharacterized protein n=1 Tax=Araneus ventricosus TaxID=182803 RepID=A0A4Y2GFT1_ARAVE|nr:hypothetical protein AVEN_827-1 [Araneus ventricosus]
MTAVNSIIYEMHGKQLINKICNVWRSTVLHENCANHTCTLLKCRNNVVAQKKFITHTIDGTGNRTRRTYLLEKEWPYGKRCRKPAPNSYFFGMKWYWLMSERIFHCPYSAILSIDISVDWTGKLVLSVKKMFHGHILMC